MVGAVPYWCIVFPSLLIMTCPSLTPVFGGQLDCLSLFSLSPPPPSENTISPSHPFTSPQGHHRSSFQSTYSLLRIYLLPSVSVVYSRTNRTTARTKLRCLADVSNNHHPPLETRRPTRRRTFSSWASDGIRIRPAPTRGLVPWTNLLTDMTQTPAI